MKVLRRLLFITLISSVLGACNSSSTSDGETAESETKTGLGAQLFADVNLSLNRTQSCSTCHDPEHAFIDPRNNGVGSAVSMGDDGLSLGDRNAPTITYAQLTPSFHFNNTGEPVGGQFHDGRAVGLAAQASGPPINPIEMGMPDKTAVIERITENGEYVHAFQQLFGSNIFDNIENAYTAMTEAIAEFEMNTEFAAFDSKYDRSRNTYDGPSPYKMTAQESLGETLFFSAQFTNCRLCHQLNTIPGRSRELFTNHRYFNIGVPANKQVRAVNGTPPDHIDNGLLENPEIDELIHRGKFKVPTLRNVAITAPYMHNGVFGDLRTVILFYDKFNNFNRTLNPETGLAWNNPEIGETVSIELLEQGGALSDDEVDSIVAFLKTLTDKRYEHLIPN